MGAFQKYERCLGTCWRKIEPESRVNWLLIVLIRRMISDSNSFVNRASIHIQKRRSEDDGEFPSDYNKFIRLFIGKKVGLS